MTSSTPIQPQQQRPPVNNNPYTSTAPPMYNMPPPAYANPYSDPMESEFNRIQQQRPSSGGMNQQQPVYPSFNSNNPYAQADTIDPNDPFGVEANRSNNKPQGTSSNPGFASLANRKK